MSTSNTYNQGIAHLAVYSGGRPLCGSRRAHISVCLADWNDWPRHCEKCQKIADKAK